MNPIPKPPPARKGYTAAMPHTVCPVHGDQAVVGISGDLLTITLDCGGVLTADGVTHKEA